MPISGRSKTNLALYLPTIPAIVLYTMVSVGCMTMSPGMQNIYSARFVMSSTGEDQQSKYEIRAGYFGMCASSSATPWLTCGASAGAHDAQKIIDKFHLDKNSTTKELVNVALIWQQKIFPSLIIGSYVLYFLGIGSITAWKRVAKMEPSNEREDRALCKATLWLRRVTLAVVWLSLALCFAATFSLSVTLNGIQWYGTVTDATISVFKGKILEVLQWALCVLSLWFAVFVTRMVWQDPRRANDEPENGPPREEMPRNGGMHRPNSMDAEPPEEMHQGGRPHPGPFPFPFPQAAHGFH